MKPLSEVAPCLLVIPIQIQAVWHAQSKSNDLSIGSTETKYIKLNTKTQNIFCCGNKNLTTYLYTMTGGQENRRRKKSFLS